MPTSSATSPSHLSRRIKDQARQLGFDDAGIAAVRPSDHAAFYRAWLDAGRHGDMTYLARPDAVERRLDPASAWPLLRSAVVVAYGYGDGDAGREGVERAGTGTGGDTMTRTGALTGTFTGTGTGTGVGIIARYARGRDYHRVMKKKLLRLLRWIEADLGHALPAARAYVDTGPVLEREFARRAGLGWFGRNTMLIHPRRGSYFFIGTLLLEVELEPDAPFEKDHCGTCSACIGACPTGALLGRDADGAPVIDATRCISYLTIENRGPIPRELRPLMGNRVFGCDICQEVCPWNGGGSRARAEARRSRAGNVHGRNLPSQRPPTSLGLPGSSGSSERRQLPVLPEARARDNGTHGLVELMGMTGDEWDAFSRGRAVRRAGRAGFLRNVAVALGNWSSPEAVPVLASALADPDELVRSHSAWALGRVGSPSAVAALAEALSAETDHEVIDEMRAALAAASSAGEDARGIPADYKRS